MSQSRNILRHTVGYLLILLTGGLTFVEPLLAQQNLDQFGLKISIENGADTSVPVKLPATEPLVVLIVDGNNRPVPGALVVFTAPELGSSGVFENGSRTLTVTADRNGRATASGFRANATAGTYQIAVQAQFLNETASSTVMHTNVGAGKQSKKMIAILAIAGAGAALGILAGSSGGGGSTTTTTPTLPTISFGGATVGAPAP